MTTLSTTEMHVGTSVIAEVIQAACLQVEGCAGFSARFYDDVAGLSERLGRFPGVTIKHKKAGIGIHLYLVVAPIRSMMDIADDVRATVANSLQLRLGIAPLYIDIKIEGIAIEARGGADHD